MKKILASVLLASPLMALAQTDIVIEHPLYEAKSLYSLGIDIERVEIKKDTTKLYCVTQHPQPGHWMQISGASYLKVGDETLPLLKADGINVNEPFYAPSAEVLERHFSLSFPEIARGVKSFDFVESDCPACFRFWNIALTPEENARIKNIHESAIKEFEAATVVTDDGKSLEPQQLMLGSTTLKVSLKGYREGIFGNEFKSQMLCYINNPLTGEQEIYYVDLSTDGLTELSLPLVSKHQQVGLEIRPFLSSSFLATQGATEELVIDIDQIIAQMSQDPSQQPVAYIYYKGANADINNSYDKVSSQTNNFFDEVINFSGVTAADFKNHVYAIADKYNKYIDNTQIPLKAKEFHKIGIRGQVAYFMSMGSFYMQEAFRRAHNLGREDALEGYSYPDFSEVIKQYPKDVNLNDIQMLYSIDYFNNIRSLGYGVNYSYLEIIEAIDAAGLIEPQDKKFIDLIRTVADRELTSDEDQKFQEFEQKYEALADEYIVKTRYAKLDQMLGEGIALNLLKSQYLCAPLERHTPIPDEQMVEIQKLGPVYAEYAKQQNDKIKAEIEAAKARGGYYVHQSNETEADALLVDVLKDHVGKVVLIDIWATWCAPCRQGIEMLKPYEPELEQKGVDFIYITDESSPEDTWNNMIVDMKGSHYRLNSNVLSKLKQKFQLSGVPSYIYVNKKGEIAHTEVGFRGVQIVKSRLDEMLAE